MRTPAAEPAIDEKHGVGTAAKQVAEHASSLARLELELAALELKHKAGALGAGVGLAVAAGLVVLYALGFGLATIAAGLSTFLDPWIALLLVTLGLLLIAGVLGLLARSRFKRGTPPVPEQAIREAKLTTQTLKSNGHG